MTSGAGEDSLAGRDGPLTVGDTFLKYEVQGVLGAGGHAVVYRGYDPFLDRHVAIKVISKPESTGRDLRERAKLEARVLVRLQHPAVVKVIDAGATEADLVYIVMELLEGRSLREVLLDVGRLTLPEVLAIGTDVAEGVHAAHAENAIHRDLKPENVFIVAGNRAKVLDFGVAKLVGYGAKTTQKDLLQGTMLYMSPEHLMGLGVTARSDVFALGTVLYEALHGRPPCLIGLAEPTVSSIAWAQINRVPPPLEERGVPRHAARVIHRMIAKDPSDRFATMEEAAAALRASLARLEVETPTPAPRELWVRARSNALRSDHSLTTRVGELGEAVPTAIAPAEPPLGDDLATRTAAIPAATPRVVAPTPPGPVGARAAAPGETVAPVVLPLGSTFADFEARGADAAAEQSAPVSTGSLTPAALAHSRRPAPPAGLSRTLVAAITLGTVLGIVGGVARSARTRHTETPLQVAGPHAAAEGASARGVAPGSLSAGVALPSPVERVTPEPAPSAAASPAPAPALPRDAVAGRAPTPGTDRAQSTTGVAMSGERRSIASAVPPARNVAPVSRPPAAARKVRDAADRPAFGAEDL